MDNHTLLGSGLANDPHPVTPPRRRPRFSLRTLLVAIAVVGCWLGWEQHVVRGRTSLRKAIERAGGTFYTGDHIPGPFPRQGPPPPSWIRHNWAMSPSG